MQKWDHGDLFSFVTVYTVKPNWAGWLAYIILRCLYMYNLCLHSCEIIARSNTKPCWQTKTKQHGSVCVYL